MPRTLLNLHLRLDAGCALKAVSGEWRTIRRRFAGPYSGIPQSRITEVHNSTPAFFTSLILNAPSPGTHACLCSCVISSVACADLVHCGLPPKREYLSTIPLKLCKYRTVRLRSGRAGAILWLCSCRPGQSSGNPRNPSTQPERAAGCPRSSLTSWSFGRAMHSGNVRAIPGYEKPGRDGRHVPGKRQCRQGPAGRFRRWAVGCRRGCNRGGEQALDWDHQRPEPVPTHAGSLQDFSIEPRLNKFCASWRR